FKRNSPSFSAVAVRVSHQPLFPCSLLALATTAPLTASLAQNSWTWGSREIRTSSKNAKCPRNKCATLEFALANSVRRRNSSLSDAPPPPTFFATLRAHQPASASH